MAHSFLHVGDEYEVYNPPIIGVDVRYHIIRRQTFERLYSHIRTDPNALGTSYPVGYSPKLPVEIQRLNFQSDELTAVLGPVELAHCAGHFDCCPALSAALLFSASVKCCSQLINYTPRITRSNTYTVVQADTMAESLAFVGDFNRMDVQLVETIDTVYRFRMNCFGKKDGRRIARGSFVLATSS